MHFFFYTSQIINFLSYPPDAMIDMSDDIYAVLTQFVWPTYELLNFKVLRSHSFILLSSLAESKLFPSGVNLTDLTAAVCPLMVLVFMDVPGYQSLIRLSYDPDAKTFSLGEKARVVHFLVWPSRSRFLLDFATFQREILF